MIGKKKKKKKKKKNRFSSSVLLLTIDCRMRTLDKRGYPRLSLNSPQQQKLFLLEQKSIYAPLTVAQLLKVKEKP